MFTAVKTKLLIAVILSSFAVAFFYYVRMLQAEVEAAKIREAQYQNIIEAKDAEVNIIKADIDKIIQSQEVINKKIRAAEASVVELEKRLTQTKSGKERDLEKLAIAKPTAIEKAINTGTIEALRCNEIATGSPLTEKEMAPNTINSICQDLIDQLKNKEITK